MRGTSGLVPENRHFFAEIKDLVRERPHVSVGWQELEGGLVATLGSDRYAYFVRVFVPLEGVRYSDNWLDIPPGARRSVNLSAPAGRRLTPSMVEVDWR